MIKKCKWCLKQFEKNGRGTKKLFCSEICLREFNSFNVRKSPFTKKGKTRIEVLKDKRKFVKCEICGQLARRCLGKHIKYSHHLDWQEYKKLYPKAKQNCQEISEYISNRQTGEKNWMWGLTYNKHHEFKGGWLSIKQEAIKIRGYKCEECGYDKHPEAIEAHHIIAKKDGGENKLSNCKLLCANCHKIHTIVKIHPFLQKQVKI